MSIELKIKIKSLAEESRIIRKEELSIKKGKFSYKSNMRRESIYLHRTTHIRPIARATYLAYGLIRGLGYKQIERTSMTIPNWSKVKSMVEKYSDSDKREENLKILNEWKSGIYQSPEMKKAA